MACTAAADAQRLPRPTLTRTWRRASLAAFASMLMLPRAASRGDRTWKDDPPACGSSCVYMADGECDDGGPGAEYLSCGCGTDCAGVPTETLEALPSL